MRKLKDFIIISDLDGTLVSHRQDIVPRNKEAVQRFIKAGGRFGIATGRSIEWIRPIAKELGVNFPCVAYNGGVVYDYSTNKTLHQTMLPTTSRIILEEISECFPTVRMLAISDDQHSQGDEDLLWEYGCGEREDFSPAHPWTTNTAPWYKVLFALPKDVYDSFFTFMEEKAYADVRFVGSTFFLGEMLPAHATKGNAIETVSNHHDIAASQIVAIGDYYNDVEMIQYAGIGATLATAPQAIQDIADVIVGSLESGAVADIIEYLEANYE